MNCPNCDTAMEPGFLTLEKTLMSALTFGFGSRELYFKSSDGGRKREEMSCWDQREAFKCPACGALVMAGRIPN